MIKKLLMSEEEKNDQWMVEWSDLAERIGDVRTRIVEETEKKRVAVQHLQSIDKNLDTLHKQMNSLIEKAKKHLQ